MDNWVNVERAIYDLRQLRKQLSGQQLAIGVSRAINRTLMKGRTEARSAVKSEYNIPQKNLSGININKSIPTTLTGSIYASAKPIPMDAFSPKFSTPTQNISVSRKGVQKVKDRSRKSKSTGVGVSIEVHKGQREVVPFAFMIANAKPRVFARGDYRTGAYGFVRRHKRVQKTGSDTPIAPLISVSVHGAVINPKSITKIKGKLQHEFPTELTTQLRFLIRNLPH